MTAQTQTLDLPIGDWIVTKTSLQETFTYFTGPFPSSAVSIELSMQLPDGALEGKQFSDFASFDQFFLKSVLGQKRVLSTLAFSASHTQGKSYTYALLTLDFKLATGTVHIIGEGDSEATSWANRFFTDTQAFLVSLSPEPEMLRALKEKEPKYLSAPSVIALDYYNELGIKLHEERPVALHHSRKKHGTGRKLLILVTVLIIIAAFTLLLSQ